MKYRKLPVEIEAVQLCWANWNEICEFLGGIVSADNPGRISPTYSDACGEENFQFDKAFIELTIPTLEGDMTASHGDFIIKGVKGEFYPCKPDIFVLLYDTVP